MTALTPIIITGTSPGPASARIAPCALARSISSAVMAASPHSATTSDLSRADITSQSERSAALRSAALQISSQKPAQPSGLLERAAGHLGDGLEVLAHDRVEQQLLGGEVAVDRAHAHLGAAGDVVDLRVDPVVGEDVRARP